MKQTFAFISPVVDSTQSAIRTEAYEQGVDLYNRGEYVQAFHSLLDYLNADFRTKYGNADGTEFHIPHGSILVHIRIADGFFHINADFLNLPEKGRVAMLRQVADLNLNKLLLPRFVKNGDKLNMEYVCPLSQSHPHKMYFVLQNICHIGDKYDDEFCTKFGAIRCYEPQVTPYPQEEVDRIYEGIQTLGRETLEALKEYGADRRYGYSWNVLDTAFYQISYFAHPQGQLLNDLDKAVNDMDADLPTEEVVSKGKAFLEKLLAVPKEKLAEDLYYTDTLVSAKSRSSLKHVQEIFLKLWQIREKLDGYNSVEALAVQVVKNLALDKLKQHRPEGTDIALLSLDSGTRNPAEELEQHDTVARIRWLISKLPSLQQTIIRMKDVEGYELAEIAEITGTQVEAVRVNLSRARKKIREQLMKEL